MITATTNKINIRPNTVTSEESLDRGSPVLGHFMKGYRMKLKCSKCKEMLDVSMFHKNSRAKSGYQSQCKKCRTPSRPPIEVRREYNKRWRERNREKFNRLTREWKARNKEKVRAHRKVNKALLYGRLEKKPCEICGELKVEAHHEDYSKPLEVVWLCRKHHVERHQEMKGENDE